MLYQKNCTNWASESDIVIGQTSCDVGYEDVQSIFLGIGGFFDHRDEESLDWEGLAHGCCKVNCSLAEYFVLSIGEVALLIGDDRPKQKDHICDNADDSISHKAGPKLEIFKNKHQDDEDESIDKGVEPSELVRRDEPRPLYNDELEVLDSQKHEIAPDTNVVEYFDDLVTVEMPKYCII